MGDVYTLLCLLRSAELSKGFGFKKSMLFQNLCSSPADFGRILGGPGT